MVDGYGRRIDYMRLSVTDRCNLSCVYCVPKSGIARTPVQELLTDEEILRIAKVAAEAGIRHLKVTGGEPLLREGVTELAGRLRQIPGIETVSLTTNGILLPRYIEGLFRAGISGVNISLDTLDASRYHALTRGGELSGALEGLKAASAYEGLTVKINVVLSEMHWQEDALALATLSRKGRIHVRFIEHMPLGVQEQERPVLEEAIRKLLEDSYGTAEPCEEKLGEGPGRYFAFPGLCGRIGFISAMSHSFCTGCNRIRLTAGGDLRMCLQSREGIGLRERLRSGITDEELVRIVAGCIGKKPEGHCMTAQNIEAEGMCQIGG